MVGNPTSCATLVPLHKQSIDLRKCCIHLSETFFFFRKVMIGNTWSSNCAASVRDDLSVVVLRTTKNPFCMDYTQPM